MEEKGRKVRYGTMDGPSQREGVDKNYVWGMGWGGYRNEARKRDVTSSAGQHQQASTAASFSPLFTCLDSTVNRTRRRTGGPRAEGREG